MSTTKTRPTTTADAPPAPALDPVVTHAQTGVTAPPASETTTKAVALYDEEDTGAGFENITQDELSVPFIAVLQKNSPQVEDGNPRQLAGAKAGMLFNTVTNKLYDGKLGIRFIPVHRSRNYIEWIPRDDGGGFVGIHEVDSLEVRDALKKAGRKFGKLKVGDNNDLVETCGLFGLLLAEDGTFERVVIAFASSQIGTYKRLMTTAQSIQVVGTNGEPQIPPLFSHVYRLRTEFFPGKNNYTWFKWRVAFDGDDAVSCRLAKDAPLYQQAKQFRAMVLSGSAAAAYETASQEETTDETEGAAGYAM